MALAINKRRAASKRSIHERHRSKRTAVRVAVTVLALTVLFIAAGVAYVWYMGRHPVQQETKPVVAEPIAPKVKTFTPPPDASVAIVRQTFSDEVTVGGNAAISIKTNAGAACQITAKVHDAPLVDTGLVPKIADEFGMVDWSWTIPKNATPGKIPVEITCANETKHSAYYKAELTVTAGN